MIEQSEIERTASLVIEEHGDNAAAFAASRVETFRDLGDLSGELTWMRVQTAIEALTAQGDPD